MKKRAVSFVLCLCMLFSLLTPSVLALEKHPFTDVTENDWFYGSVAYAYEHNLMNGISDTTFAPNDAAQRGMLVTVLHRLAGSPVVIAANPFTDVPEGSYCENAIIWAVNNGIVNGYNSNTFGPYDTITRQQMATMLFRYAQMRGYRISTDANLSDYVDADQISDFAKPAMAWANGEGGRLAGLPCHQYKREPERVSRAAALAAVHFTLDAQAGFCYSGIRSAK